MTKRPGFSSLDLIPGLPRQLVPPKPFTVKGRQPAAHETAILRSAAAGFIMVAKRTGALPIYTHDDLKAVPAASLVEDCGRSGLW